MKRKTIFFMDLEGTLVEDGTFHLDEMDFIEFLIQFSKIEEMTNSKISLNLVSPVNMQDMIQVKDRMNFNIEKFNRQHHKNLQEVESAACYVENGESYKDARIVPLSSKGERASKYLFVKPWYELLKEKYDIINCFYIGDGVNDYDAMQFVKDLPNGKVICPENANEKVKSVADYVGKGQRLKGVIQAMEQMRRQKEQEERNF